MSSVRVADMAQKGVSLLLFGLTLYGTVVLAKGGYGVVQRHRQRKRSEVDEETVSRGHSTKWKFILNLQATTVPVTQKQSDKGLESR